MKRKMNTSLFHENKKPKLIYLHENNKNLYINNIQNSIRSIKNSNNEIKNTNIKLSNDIYEIKKQLLIMNNNINKILQNKDTYDLSSLKSVIEDIISEKNNSNCDFSYIN